jgi:nitrogen regulatory protein PII 2
MKKVMAFLRARKVNETKEALAAAGFPAFTCRAALGRGKGVTDARLAEVTAHVLTSGEELPYDEATVALTELVRLLPIRLFILVLEDDRVDDAVECIMRVNTTGHPGDGRIFIVDVTEAYCVRTGTEGL